MKGVYNQRFEFCGRMLTVKEIERNVAEMLPYTFHCKLCSIVPDLTIANKVVTGGLQGWNGVVQAPVCAAKGVPSIFYGTFASRSQLP